MITTSPLDPFTVDQEEGPLSDQERLVLAMFRRIREEQQKDILRFLEAFAALPTD